MKLIDKLKTIKPKELYRFLICGTSSVLLDFCAYYMLMRIGVELNVAKAGSFILGALLGFVLNKSWTFESKEKLFKEAPKYAILYAVTAFANTLVNSAVLRITNISILGFLFATSVSTVLNFLGLKFIVFVS